MRLFYFLFFIFWSSVIISPFLKFFILDKFILKTCTSRRVSYFVVIVSGVGNTFLLDCPQNFSLLKVRFRDISESHKSPVQKKEFSYK